MTDLISMHVPDQHAAVDPDSNENQICLCNLAQPFNPQGNLGQLMPRVTKNGRQIHMPLPGIAGLVSFRFS